MSTKLAINLHKLARFTNTAIPIFTLLSFLAGWRISFYFHFLTVPMIGLTLINYYYLFAQRNHSLLRNFGILGQGRYMLESLGPELRQYLYSGDTEERPFNRTERAEVYRKANNVDSASSFGSQNDFDATEVKLRHSLFPISKENLLPYRLTFGEERGIQKTYTLTVPFIISGMSYGALGKSAIRSLARGIAQTGGLMNTGEGGYPKYHLMENCDLAFQIGTAKFGVRQEDGTLDDQRLADLAAKDQVRLIELKLSQGAKPGKGGMLPKEKITAEISELRGVPMGQDVVSPTHHPECEDYHSTVAFIRRIQEVSHLPVGIKLCMGDPRQFAELVAEMKRQDSFPDWITIDGAEGGTGAAPKAFIDRVGMPLFPALKSAQDALVSAGVRQRLKLVASGKLINPGSQIIAFCLGADAIATARGFMLSIGCIQAMQCGSNTCPVGITSHNPKLERGIDIADKALRVANYVHSLEHDLDELLCAAGARCVRELSFDHLYVPNETLLYPFAHRI
ncbi:FMN-binding glutamate synthase family protein [Pelagicoccus sp. SDUM812002]|uniref:FMN-binding glutamate synthase family protein n=1 Tax=Pelagicoccus sp. SDUM812002 TaxID=3041266 RepID=UPI00280E2B45|nr:FMN-binding glutamate synthase family protein [Pelagicoccus sp. SDUM812002]MDQ8187363.1 FMN-binding glutamate synthase family protein [Pelagicoccus sp. SDUM812002]